MARLALNKSSLNRERARLKTFERFLPSLDLKRRQLIAERGKAAQALAASRAELERIRQAVARELPMLSDHAVDLADLATVREARVGQENVMGARLPVLEAVEVAVRDYALLGKPHWVDAVAARLAEALTLRLRLQVEERRLALLERAVDRITQRVNLFDKVLIPRTRQGIKRIQIHLAEAERSAVVRAKLAKRKRAREAAL